ncbi:hypothetical protein [Gordonia sihwensis]|uniref:hypothetical protein n=1 Tax=Gordonia sihwensis TaxID=173559 RepID=UPI003D98DD04
MKKSTRTLTAAVLGAAAIAAGVVGAGMASADTAAGVADGCYWGNTVVKHADAVTGYVALPVTVEGNSISVLGQPYKLTPTATGGTANVLGQRVTLTATGDGAYDVTGGGPVVKLVTCGDEVYGAGEDE